MKILQIAAAAPGWYAAFKLPDGTRVEQRIPLWGLVKFDNNPEPRVQALTPIYESEGLYPVQWPTDPASQRFIGYYHKDADDAGIECEKDTSTSPIHTTARSTLDTQDLTKAIKAALLSPDKEPFMELLGIMEGKDE